MNKERNKKLPLEILHIEDSLLDAELIYEHLGDNLSGTFSIHLVSKKEEFISAIKFKKYDIILCDFQLPGFNGFEALQYSKSICPSTPFIYISGFIGEELAVELLKLGATDYVLKDKLARLVFSIERALKESREVDEKQKRLLELISTNEELVRKNNEIIYLSNHDLLTNLYNRIYFESEKNSLNTARQLPISIITGDINGLKLINDGFGHSKGDEILIEVSKLLKKCCREEDIIARIGGDEFGILLPNTDSQTAQLICIRIDEACNEHVLSGNQIFTSISVGHATKTNVGELIDDIFRASEESMYRKKLLQSKSAHSSIIASIKTTMFEKSHETAEHAERLVQLSKMIGLALSLNEQQLDELELLATLHDIGKMGINDNILIKKEKLNDEEWMEMKQHPAIGFRIAQATTDLIPIANFILCHHERWDGKGYPQGLMGEEIPLLSRILGVVDAYDAMTFDRSYRVAMTKNEAIEEIKKNAGSQFDPSIAELFIKMIS